MCNTLKLKLKLKLQKSTKLWKECLFWMLKAALTIATGQIHWLVFLNICGKNGSANGRLSWKQMYGLVLTWIHKSTWSLGNSQSWDLTEQPEYSYYKSLISLHWDVAMFVWNFCCGKDKVTWWTPGTFIGWSQNLLVTFTDVRKFSFMFCTLL